VTGGFSYLAARSATISVITLNITADEDLLSQVWNNLIHNSIKFTKEALLRLHYRSRTVRIGKNHFAEDQLTPRSPSLKKFGK
jgi:signal transduction histidine kinase